MSHSDRRRVVHIICPGRSGSTLLGFFLNAHSRIFNVGEIVSPTQRGRPFECRNCINGECPIWGKVLSADFVQSCVKAAGLMPRRESLIRRLLQRRHEAELRGAIYEKLFDSIEGVDTIVDTSKNVAWARWNSRSRGFESLVLHLTRDLRATTNSVLRSRREIPIEHAAGDIVKSVRSMQKFVKRIPAERVLQLKYESLVKDPECTGRRLCRFLSLPFESEMLEYNKVEQCVMAGNPGPIVQDKASKGRSTTAVLETVETNSRDLYATRAPGFFLDERWKTELSQSELKTLDSIVAPVNGELGYTDDSEGPQIDRE